MPKVELNPCDVCSLRTNSELNFLLNCFTCKRGFHHRCCRPPIPDEVLTSLLNATLKKKPGKGIHYWKCYDCREGRGLTTASGSGTLSPSIALLSKKRKQDEVIVISDDEDEQEPRKEIVVSSRPPAQNRDTQQETNLPIPVPPKPPRTAASAVVSNREGEKRVQHDTGRASSIYVEQDLPLPEPPSSTSRFGLLSPPVSISGSSTRHTSTAPSFIDDKQPQPQPQPRRSDSGPNSRLEHAHLHVDPVHHVPPTPISMRTQSPLDQAQGLLEATVPEAPTIIARQDLKLLGRAFKDTYHSDIKTTTGSQSAGKGKGVASHRGRRKPRKLLVAKELDRNARTYSQFSYFHCDFV